MTVRVHGDRLVAPGSLDFAVNVWPGRRPAHLRRALQQALASAAYPDTRAACEAAALRHGRRAEEILPLNGACEAFWLLATALRPLRAAAVHPGFGEAEAALRAAGSDVVRVFRDPRDWQLDPDAVPEDAALVVVGNPENPSGRLETAELLCRLRHAGRLVVVDESFIEFVPGEEQSLAGEPGIVVIRSLTKLWSLAGIRVGYLIGPADLVARLEAHRQPWSVSAPACAAIVACCGDPDTPALIAREVARERRFLEAALAHLPFVEHVWPGAANFLLMKVADGPTTLAGLRARGVSVRPAGSFPGLDDDHIRVAVRRRADNRRLLAALSELAR